ncbi:pilus assembly protein [Crossiella sp. SN42]|uniref:TadE/TadG family type IV pilus assembly protein n=1 Tax=Crossiella sp. SN42 TaxID=2944808 RepID=UPI00207C40B4|nr:TadE/TadG family type IV pilus assembly protein [Crossiella sp. SN42]MCO1575884.1 pilus assembly protein [Crossiella sp. SN42]
MCALTTSERGSAAAELVLLTPLLILVLLFVVFCGKLAHISLRLNDAAHQAARAATLTREPSQATASARGTAEAALASAGINCRSLAVTAGTGQFRPGGAVNVTLTCRVDVSQLTMLGVPGTHVVTASSSSPLDTHRGITTGGTP